MEFQKLFRYTKPTSEKIVKGFRIINLAAASFSIALLLDASIAAYRDIRRERKLSDAFRKGAVPRPGCFVAQRSELAAEVKQILQPPEGYSKYHLAVGNDGTGKTSLIRQVGHECSGIIYVSIPKDISYFEDQFAHAINWSPPNDGWLWKIFARVLRNRESESRQVESFDIIFREFQRQARIFAAENHRPAVLVLDNINHLAEEDPARLVVLQAIAKESADDRQFITVFVTSGGKAIAQLDNESASSRMRYFEIGDLNWDETRHYLCKHHDKTEAEAGDIYRLVGGRFIHLSNVLDNLNEGEDFDVCKQQVYSLAEAALKKADMHANGRHRDIGLKVMEHILQHGSIRRSDYDLMVGDELGKKLLGFRVLSYSSYSNEVTFHSKHIENYMEMEDTQRRVKEARGNFLAEE